MKPYLGLTKSGRSIVLTTDASCLGNTHAQAIFELQAGFHPGFFAPCLPGKSYQNTTMVVLFSVIDHSKSLCSRLHIQADTQPCLGGGS